MRVRFLSAATPARTMPWRATGKKVRRPRRPPTVIPTRSSYLQRLVWLFMPGL